MDTLSITFDPAIRPDGQHALRSDYVETFWLPKVGPSAICFLRAMGNSYAPIEHLCQAPTIEMPFAEVSAAMGLTRRKPSKNHRLLRMLSRLEWAQLLQRDNELDIRLAPYLPTLHANQIATLPVSIQALHTIELTNLK